MTVTPRTASVPRRAAPVALAALTVVAAGTAGWVLAGPPGDATAVVPPACPAVGSVGEGAGEATGAGLRPAEAGRLVPMPLPQPRGPVSVRICHFTDGGRSYVLERSVAVEPVRTAELAGLLNGSPGQVVDAASVRACPQGGAVDVLMFRYTEGAPARVDVLGGECGLVRTAARVERDRGDVVRRIGDLLGSV